MCLTKFEDIKLHHSTFHCYHMGDSKLAWNINMPPLEHTIHGLYARIQFLPSFYMQTFEEMFSTGFIEIAPNNCFSKLASLNASYLAHRIVEMENPTMKPPLTEPTEITRNREIEAAIAAVQGGQ